MKSEKNQDNIKEILIYLIYWLWRGSAFGLYLADGKGYSGVEDPPIGVREGQWTL